MIEILRNYIQSMFESEKKFDSTRFRLSESGFHPEWRLKKALGLFDSSKENLKGLFWTGLAYEELVAKYFGKSYKQRIRYQKEIKSPDTPGHWDIVIADIIKIGIEVKTTSLKNMQNVPLQYNIMQVQSYLHFDKEIKDAILIYIPREDPHPNLWRWYPVCRNEEIGKEIEETLLWLMALRETGEMPLNWDEKYKKYYIPPDDLQYINGNAVPAGDFSEYSALIEEYVNIKETRKNAGVEASGLADRQKELEEQIDKLFNSPLVGRKKSGTPFILFNDYEITKIEQTRESYDIKSAIICGAVSRDQVKDFKKITGSVSYRVKNFNNLEEVN